MIMDCSTVIIKQSEKNIRYTDTDRGIVDFSTVIITAQASAFATRMVVLKPEGANLCDYGLQHCYNHPVLNISYIAGLKDHCGLQMAFEVTVDLSKLGRSLIYKPTTSGNSPTLCKT